METVTELQTTLVITPLEEEIGRISRKSRAVTVAAIALCRLYGPRPDCLCNNGKSACYAFKWYGDYALAVVPALDKADLLKT